jgi:hypothetical protein
MIFCDARETLAQFMVDGQPDPDLFEKAVGSIVRSFAAPSQSGLCVYGEMVDLLWNAGRSTAASRLEGLWNALLATNHFNSCAPIKSASSARNSSPGFSTTSCAPTPRGFGRHPRSGPRRNQRHEEVLGSRAQCLTQMVRSQSHPSSWAEIPEAESTVLWLRTNFPDYADQILARARQYYRGGAAYLRNV